MTTTNSTDDRKIEELYKKAYGRMESSADAHDLARTVRAAAGSTGRAAAGHRRMTRRAFVGLASCAVVLTAGVALAATQHDFLSTAFGPKGHEDVEAREELEEGKTEPYTMPGRQWADTDAETVERLVGAYVEEVGESISIERGATLTVESCVTDANGLGVATYRLEADEDLGVGTNDFGEVYNGVVQVGLRDWYDYCSIYYADSLTDTGFEAALYFGPLDMGPTDESRTVTWHLADAERWDGVATEVDENGLPLGDATLAYTPQTVVPTQAFTCDDDGLTASMSPLGMVVEADTTTSDAWQGVEIRFADGSSYAAKGADVYNVVTSWSNGSAAGYLFNRLIDVDEVASVVITGHDPDDWDVPVEHVLVRAEG
jgi:hypothetical protein